MLRGESVEALRAGITAQTHEDSHEDSTQDASITRNNTQAAERTRRASKSRTDITSAGGSSDASKQYAHTCATAQGARYTCATAQGAVHMRYCARRGSDEADQVRKSVRMVPTRVVARETARDARKAMW